MQLREKLRIIPHFRLLQAPAHARIRSGRLAHALASCKDKNPSFSAKRRGCERSNSQRSDRDKAGQISWQLISCVIPHTSPASQMIEC
jgi:hypothetical protein